MRSILVVDDDYIARSKIKSIISWEEYGYTIISEASNGKEALEIMENDMPQIALIDMDMPVMNGVELIREIKARNYPVAVVVLSSYNDFAYVRDSMKLGALDYVLKNELNPVRLLNILSEAEISREGEKEFLPQDKAYIQELYVRKILLGISQEGGQSLEWVVHYHLPIDSQRNMLAVCELDDYYLAVEKMDKKGLFAFQQFVENLFREAAQKVPEMTVAKMKDRLYCLVLSCGSIYSLGTARTFMENVLLEIRRNLMRFLNMTVSISISPICLNLRELAKYYEMAEEKLKNKFYLGKDGIIQEHAIDRGYKQEQTVFDIRQEKEILMMFSAGDKEGISKKLNEIFGDLKKNGRDEVQVRQVITEILGFILTVSKRKKIDFSALCGVEEPFQRMKQYETLGDLEKWISDICIRVCNVWEEDKNREHYTKLTVKALEYISDHYKEPISLIDTAEYLGVSSSHLSRVFKNDTGTKFVNYLNQIRISKAKFLLEGEFSGQLKRIARETGFNNYNHFFSTFKSIVGMSPNEYLDRKK